MHKSFILVAGACLLSLTACDHKTAGAENVISSADNAADMMQANATAIRDTADSMGGNAEMAMDNRANALDNTADSVRGAAANKADALDAAVKGK